MSSDEGALGAAALREKQAEGAHHVGLSHWRCSLQLLKDAVEGVMHVLPTWIHCLCNVTGSHALAMYQKEFASAASPSSSSHLWEHPVGVSAPKSSFASIILVSFY